MHGLKTAMTSTETDSIRLDKWLWSARFFKTRRLAAEAVAGGKVHLNGQRCKPAKEVKTGDRLTITKEQYNWNLLVKGINKHRRPYSEAILLYEETPESAAKRKEQVALNKQQASQKHSSLEKKPNKKQRRQIHRFKQG